MTLCLIVFSGFALLVLGGVLIALSKPAEILPPAAKQRRVIHTAHREATLPGILGTAIFSPDEVVEIQRAARMDPEVQRGDMQLAPFLTALDHRCATAPIHSSQIFCLHYFAAKNQLKCLTRELQRLHTAQPKGVSR